MTKSNNNKSSDQTANESMDDNLPRLDNGVAKPDDKSKRFKFRSKLLLVPLVFMIFPIGAFVGLYFQPPGLQFFMRTTGLLPGGGNSNPIAVPEKPSAPASEQVEGKTVTALGTLLPLQDVSVLAPPFRLERRPYCATTSARG